MSQKAKIAIILGAMTPLLVLIAVVAIGLRGTPQKQVLASTTSSGDTSNDSSPSQLSIDQGGDNALGGGLISVSPSGQTNANTSSTAATPQNANITTSGQSTTSSTSTTKSDGQTATLDPTKFSQYDQYKTGQNALFGDIQTGAGTEITAGKTAVVNYRGWLTNGTLFDQNISSDKPFSFVLGAHNVILGWEQAIAGMKVGGERLLIIPPAVGYGSKGQGPIPGDAVLVFDVKLVAVQ